MVGEWTVIFDSWMQTEHFDNLFLFCMCRVLKQKAIIHALGKQRATRAPSTRIIQPLGRAGSSSRSVTRAQELDVHRVLAGQVYVRLLIDSTQRSGHCDVTKNNDDSYLAGNARCPDIIVAGA